MSGLVSFPTSGEVGHGTEETGPRLTRTQLESRALRESVRGVAPGHGARLARLRRSVGFAARGLEAAAQKPGHRPDWVLMVTLTYRPGAEWHPLHVTQFTRALRAWCKWRGYACRYVWVAELQKRGAVHYHLAVWLPRGVRMPKPDAVGWWPHGMTQRIVAKRAVPYLMKYMSKGSEGAKLPDGARMHGSGGLEHAYRRAKRWLGLPAFIRARADIFDDWRRAPGGGWLTPDGFVIPSEFSRAWLGDRWGCVQVVDYGRPFEAAGPFSWINRGAQWAC